MKKKKRKKEYALKTKYVCTHIHIKWLHHPLTAFAPFSIFFLFFFFTYEYSFARLTLMQSFLSVSFLFRAFVLSASLSLSLSHSLIHTHMLDVCMCMRVLISFLSSPFSYSLHTTMVTLELRDEILLKKKEECAYIHVIVHSIRQNAFEVSLCFFYSRS